MARLLVSTPNGRERINLTRRLILGRLRSSDLRLSDPEVSKEHCAIEPRDGSFFVRDLGSLNGTFLNGIRLEGEVRLRDGDAVFVGNAVLRFEDDERAEDSTPIESLPRRIAPARRGR